MFIIYNYYTYLLYIFITYIYYYIADEAAVSSQCFSKFNNGQCSSLLYNQTSKKECCCENPQRAFGLCSVCPAKGQGIAYF